VGGAHDPGGGGTHGLGGAGGGAAGAGASGGGGGAGVYAGGWTSKPQRAQKRVVWPLSCPQFGHCTPRSLEGSARRAGSFGRLSAGRVRSVAMASRAVSGLRVSAAVLVSAVALGACAQPGFNAQKLERQLVRAGATPEEARCVTTSMENKFDLNELASHSEPSALDLATAHDLLVKCKVKLPPPASTRSS